MKTLTAFLLCLALAQLTTAQTTEKEYLDLYHNVTKDITQARCFRTVTYMETGKWQVEEFSVSGVKKCTAEYSDKELTVLDGELISYYPNSLTKSKTRWIDGKETGFRETWYSNGQPKAAIQITAVDSYVRSYFDSLGNQKVINGNGDYEEDDKDDDSLPFHITIKGRVLNGKREGVFKGYKEDGTLFCEETYRNGELIKGVSFKDGKEYKYKEYFDVGYKSIVNYIRSNLTYPASARKSKSAGTVLIKIMFNKDNSLKDIVVLKGFHPECDSAAVNVFKYYKFRPFLLRGQEVHFPYFNLPIVFAL